MTPDDAGYVGDLINTAEGHLIRARALLADAARILGGEARDAPAVHYRPDPRLTGEVNPLDHDLVDGYACPIDPMEALACESCQ